MQFVPSFDFGAAVQGFRTAQKDWREQELFPIERDLKQAQLEQAQANAQLATQTTTNRINEANSRLLFSTDTADAQRSLLGDSLPGMRAQAQTTSRGRVINSELLTDDLLRQTMGATLATRTAGAQISAQDSAAALARNPTVNAARDAAASTQLVDAEGARQRADAVQVLRGNQLALEAGLTEDKLARLPDLVRNQAAQIQLDYEKLAAASTDLQMRGEAAGMAQRAYAMTGQYADVQAMINDPAAISSYVEKAAQAGRTITPQQAQVELDQRAQTLARAITALQGQMQMLVRNNETSFADSTDAAVRAGRVPAAGAGATPSNPMISGSAAPATAAAPVQKLVDTPVKIDKPPERELTPIQQVGEQRKAIEKRIGALSAVSYSGFLGDRELSATERKQVIDKERDLMRQVELLKIKEKEMKKAEKDRAAQAELRNLLGN